MFHCVTTLILIYFILNCDKFFMIFNSGKYTIIHKLLESYHELLIQLANM